MTPEGRRGAGTRLPASPRRGCQGAAAGPCGPTEVAASSSACKARTWGPAGSRAPTHPMHHVSCDPVAPWGHTGEPDNVAATQTHLLEGSTQAPKRNDRPDNSPEAEPVPSPDHTTAPGHGPRRLHPPHHGPLRTQRQPRATAAGCQTPLTFLGRLHLLLGPAGALVHLH